MIFTGTPGRTQAVNEGNVVEVHIEGVGTLINRFVWE
ncbi:MAG: fumarylacetoacetate hydrolase family protein [Spirochaetaceae bacterium]